MSLIQDYERMEIAKQINSYKNSFISEKQAFDAQLDAMTDPAKPYGFMQSFIDMQQNKITRMIAMKPGLTLAEQSEIDALIAAGNNKIDQMKLRYTTDIYNPIHGV